MKTTTCMAILVLLAVLSGSQASLLKSLRQSHASGWEAFISQSLEGSGFVTQACIIGHDGEIWAVSPGLNFVPENAQSIARAFNNPAALPSTGLTLSGVAYTGASLRDGVIRAKNGGKGVVIAKSGQAFVVGFYEGGITEDQAAGPVKSLAGDMIDMSY